MKKAMLTVLPLLALVLAFLAGPAFAEEDLTNEVTAYVHPGDSDRDVVVDVWMSNVNPVIGITLPLKFAAKPDTISFTLDSLSLAGGRAELFYATKPVFKSSNNTLLVNMLWRMDTTKAAPPIPPGEGPLATIYMHASAKVSLKDFKMATVLIPPENVILYVTETLNSVNPAFAFVIGDPPQKKETSKSGAGAEGKSK